MYGATERNQGTKVCGNPRLIVAAIVPHAVRGAGDARPSRGARVSCAPRDTAVAAHARWIRWRARAPSDPADRVPRVAARQRTTRRDRARDPRAPGGDRVR